MPKATLITTTVLACLVLVLGCLDGATEPEPTRKTIHRSTTIWSPSVGSDDAKPAPRSRPAPPKPEPVMSVPPREKALDAPVPAPKPPPAAPRPPPSHYRDGCGRPLVA